MLLVNSDLILAPDAIGHLEAALRTHPAAGIAGPAVLVRSDPARVESMGIHFSAATGRTATTASAGVPSTSRVRRSSRSTA